MSCTELTPIIRIYCYNKKKTSSEENLAVISSRNQVLIQIINYILSDYKELIEKESYDEIQQIMDAKYKGSNGIGTQFVNFIKAHNAFSSKKVSDKDVVHRTNSAGVELAAQEVKEVDIKQKPAEALVECAKKLSGSISIWFENNPEKNKQPEWGEPSVVKAWRKNVSEALSPGEMRASIFLKNVWKDVYEQVYKDNKNATNEEINYLLVLRVLDKNVFPPYRTLNQQHQLETQIIKLLASTLGIKNINDHLRRIDDQGPIVENDVAGLSRGGAQAPQYETPRMALESIAKERLEAAQNVKAERRPVQAKLINAYRTVTSKVVDAPVAARAAAAHPHHPKNNMPK